jgi:hypothetical protein
MLLYFRNQMDINGDTFFYLTCDRSVVFSGTPVSSTNKTDSHDIAEILLKVTINIIALTLTSIII